MTGPRIFVFVYILALVVAYTTLQWRESTQKEPALYSTDWELVGACVWERWDQAAGWERTGQIMRFCVEVYPYSLEPGLPEPRG